MLPETLLLLTHENIIMKGKFQQLRSPFQQYQENNLLKLLNTKNTMKYGNTGPALLRAQKLREC